MIELTERQRKDYLQRHLSNALFYKLSQGKWRTVTSGKPAPNFQILGAGKGPDTPRDPNTVLYAWLATVSTALPRFGFFPYAILIDSVVYSEFLGQFSVQTRESWAWLLQSGTRQLYRFQDNSFRRNETVHPLMCAIGTGLIERLEEMRLIIPIDRLDDLDLRETHKEQMVIAALRYPDP